MALPEKIEKLRINLLKFGAASEIFWMFNVSQLQRFFKILGSFAQNTPEFTRKHYFFQILSKNQLITPDGK